MLAILSTQWPSHCFVNTKKYFPRFQFIVDYVSQFGETFCKVLAIRPSGWERSKNKPNFANRISILGVQYSEHSSYNELERFVRFLRPKQVISTVPFTSQNLNRTPKVPAAWLNQKLEPKRESYQRNIMDFMVKVRSTYSTQFQSFHYDYFLLN